MAQRGNKSRLEGQFKKKRNIPHSERPQPSHLRKHNGGRVPVVTALRHCITPA